jgi:hypothetical protein
MRAAVRSHETFGMFYEHYHDGHDPFFIFVCTHALGATSVVRRLRVQKKVAHHVYVASAVELYGTGPAFSTYGARATNSYIKVTGMACLSHDPFTTDHTVQHRSLKTLTFTINAPRNLFPFVFIFPTSLRFQASRGRIHGVPFTSNPIVGGFLYFSCALNYADKP